MKALVLFLLLTALLRPNMVASGTVRSLPHPSGSFGASRVAYDWVDASRRETAINDPNAHRELMVYLWYPTVKKPMPANRVPYLPGADKIAKDGGAKDLTEFWGDAWPEIVSGQIVSETSEHAPIASGTEKFPLLVFAPGLGLSSTTYTSTIQELVSHGYVIASIEPTYEVGAVVFPDARVITERPEATGRGPSPPNESREQFLKRLHSFDAGHINKWADDMRYVIDRVTRLNGETGATRAPFAGRIDLSNIGAWGHSFGGRAAARLCQIDEHVKACLDADGLGPDGPIFAYEGEKLPSQPFMWIEVFHVPPSDSQLAPYGMTREQWEKNHAEQLLKNEKELSECRGGSYHITVNLPEIEHFSFTDQPIITAKTKQDIDHAIDTLTILDDYVRGFFDRYLKAS
jgi:predicted dienelactone hydrolase